MFSFLVYMCVTYNMHNSSAFLSYCSYAHLHSIQIQSKKKGKNTQMKKSLIYKTTIWYAQFLTLVLMWHITRSKLSLTFPFTPVEQMLKYTKWNAKTGETGIWIHNVIHIQYCHCMYMVFLYINNK